MKTLFLILIAAQFAFAQTFEGVLEISTYSKINSENADVKWYIKDGNSKLEITGSADGQPYRTNLLLKKNDSQMYLLTEIEGKNAVYAVPQNSMIESVKNSNSRVVKMEGSRNIAGYNCYQLKIESPEETIICWFTDELKLNAESFPPALRSKGIIGILKSNDIRGIPLEVKNTNPSGEITQSFTVEKISSQALNESLFEVPSDVQKGEDLLKKSVKVE